MASAVHEGIIIFVVVEQLGDQKLCTLFDLHLRVIQVGIGVQRLRMSLRVACGGYAEIKILLCVLNQVCGVGEPVLGGHESVFALGRVSAQENYVLDAFGFEPL